MNPKRIMLIAGEASGDMLAAELVKALRAASPSSLVFFGAGGPKMAEAGVELAFDLTQHSTIGISWLKKYFELRRLFHQLVRLALDRKPDVIIGVDYNLFNLRFAEAIKDHIRKHDGQVTNWNPKIVKYVSPQVWASRPARAEKMARDFDLLLSIFPFEKDWYAKRVPNLRVEFIGHPILDRSQKPEVRSQKSGALPLIVFLPGSREAELRRHWPVMLGIASQLFAKARYLTIVPDQKSLDILKSFGKDGIFLLDEMLLDHNSYFHSRVGGLAEALSEATLAIASTGTVTLECAYFGVPTIAIYKTSWSTYQIGKRIVQVKFLAMPNLLANEAIFPEYIQHEATAENISREAISLLNSTERREEIKRKLSKIIESLGGPGASERAAKAILSL